MKSVCIVVPTRNEEKNIGDLLRRLKGYDVLIVDDSDDATAEVAVSFGATVVKGQRKGLGQAIVDGIRACKADVAVVMDADLSHRPEDLPKLIQPVLDGYSMAIGSRYIKGGQIPDWGIKRRVISRVAGLMAYPLTGLQDNTSGFFALDKHSLNGAVLRPDSWKIMLEVLVKTKARATEVPIVFEDRRAGKSKFTFKQMAAYIKHLFLLAMYKYRVLNFMFVGGIGYLVNMGVYYPLTLVFKNSVEFLGQHFYLPPFVLSSVVAIVSNYHFNRKWTFGDRKAKPLSFLRYFNMAGVTLLLDLVVLFLLVDYAGLNPMLAASLAIAFVFVLRYIISDKWIWSKKHA